MGELVPLQRPSEVAAQDEPGVIPVHIIQAIAIAAVEAYKEQQRMERNAQARIYYKVNRDRILKNQRRRRSSR